MKKFFAWIFIMILGVAVVLAAFVFSLNKYIEQYGQRYNTDAHSIESADAIIVLGALVYDDGTPSLALRHRLDRALELYENGVSDRILVSGDHGTTSYDEVNNMRQYLQDHGVPRDAIFMDHAGFDTYESMYRARDVFLVKKPVIVTQHFHNVRALYIARQLGLAAFGVDAEDEPTMNMQYYALREYGARAKAFLQAGVMKPEPTFLGDAIPIWKSGTLTDDGN